MGSVEYILCVFVRLFLFFCGFIVEIISPGESENVEIETHELDHYIVLSICNLII